MTGLKRLSVLAIALPVIGAGLMAASPAKAWVRWGVGVVVPPVVVAPPPPVYYAPPPVYYAPPPVAYYPAPVYRPIWVPGRWVRGYWVPGHYA